MSFPKPAKIIWPHFVGPQAPQMIFPRPGKIIWPPFVVVGLRPPNVFPKLGTRTRQPVLADSGRAGKNHLPLSPRASAG